MKKMEALSSFQVFEKLCKATNKWGLYISIYEPEDGPWEATKAAPYLNEKDHIQIIMDGHGIFLFDNQEEMEKCYWQTVGDDGPTKINKYNGLTRVYALTCDPTGQLHNENT